MLSKKKKIVILCGMIALLVLTGVLNVFLNTSASGKDMPTNGEVTYGDFFATYRTDRQATRNQSIEYLDAMITSASSSEEVIAQAQEKKIALVDMMNKEQTLEGLIKAQGYTDCIVTMSTDNLNCIVKTSELDETKVAKILNTLVTETGREATGIKIIPID